MLSTASVQRLAERIYAEEAGNGSSVDEAIAAVERVHLKLARAICPVVGDAGFGGIVGRIVHKSKTLHPCLANLVGLNGVSFVEGLRASLKNEDLATIRSIGVTVLSGVLALMSTFIGDELVLRLLLSSWPESIAHAIGSVEKS